MRMVTTLLQVLMVGGAVWILYALYISRQTVANSARVCPSCNVELGKFDAVHCQDCLEFGEIFGAEYKASFSGGVN